MIDWIYDEKRAFLELLKGSFSSLTEQDAKDCYAELKPFGLAIAMEAVKRVRREAKGGAMFRPDIKAIGNTGLRIATDQGATKAAEKREVERVSESKYRDWITSYWAKVAESRNLFTDEELTEWKAKFLDANPDLRRFYANKDPRTNRVLLAHIIEFGVSQVPA